MDGHRGLDHPIPSRVGISPIIGKFELGLDLSLVHEQVKQASVSSCTALCAGNLESCPPLFSQAHFFFISSFLINSTIKKSNNIAGYFKLPKAIYGFFKLTTFLYVVWGCGQWSSIGLHHSLKKLNIY